MLLDVHIFFQSMYVIKKEYIISYSQKIWETDFQENWMCRRRFSKDQNTQQLPEIKKKEKRKKVIYIYFTCHLIYI